MKALVAYATRYGAAGEIAVRISRILSEMGVDTTTIDLKREHVNSISRFELVIVGSGIKMGRWTKEADGFLKNHSSEMVFIPHALYVASGAWPLFSEGGPLEHEMSVKVSDFVITREMAFTQYLKAMVTKYALDPIALGLFGGVWDFREAGPFWRMLLSRLMGALEKNGVDTGRPYDNRDWAYIEQWTRGLITSFAK